jgi:hypothetical protein
MLLVATTSSASLDKKLAFRLIATIKVVELAEVSGSHKSPRYDELIVLG